MTQTIQPDITLYYNQESRKELITTRVPDAGGFIYSFKLSSDYENTNVIGNIIYTGTTSYLYEITTSAFFVSIKLPEGDINCSLQRTTYTEKLDTVLPPGLYYLPITGGSGNFSFVKGTVVLNKLTDKNRIIYIYFIK